MPKEHTLAACMSLANCLCPALHGAASVVGYDQSPQSIKPPVAMSQSRVHKKTERRHGGGAPTVEEEKVGFFASLFSRKEASPVVTAPATREEEHEENAEERRPRMLLGETN